MRKQAKFECSEAYLYAPPAKSLAKANGSGHLGIAAATRQR